AHGYPPGDMMTLTYRRFRDRDGDRWLESAPGTDLYHLAASDRWHPCLDPDCAVTRDEATQAHGPIQDMPDLDVEEPVEPDPDPPLPITELSPPQMRDRQVEIADLAADLINATRERQATKAVQAVARATDEFGLMAGMYGICVQLAEVVWVGSA